MLYHSAHKTRTRTLMLTRGGSLIPALFFSAPEMEIHLPARRRTQTHIQIHTHTYIHTSMHTETYAWTDFEIRLEFAGQSYTKQFSQSLPFLNKSQKLHGTAFNTWISGRQIWISGYHICAQYSASTTASPSFHILLLIAFKKRIPPRSWAAWLRSVLVNVECGLELVSAHSSVRCECDAKSVYKTNVLEVVNFSQPKSCLSEAFHLATVNVRLRARTHSVACNVLGQ